MKHFKSLFVMGPFIAGACVACGGSQPEPETPMPPPSNEPAPPPPAPPDVAPAPEAAPAASAAPTSAPAPEPPKTASYDITAKSGSKLTGKVTLTDTGSGVDVLIEVAG